MSSSCINRQATPKRDKVLPSSTGKSTSSGGYPSSPSSASSGSVQTPDAISSDNKSPGSSLLPRIRRQDQILDPHEFSIDYKTLPRSTGSGYTYPPALSGFRTRSLTPPEGTLLTPISADLRFPSFCDQSNQYLPPSSLAHTHPSSGHIRSISTPYGQTLPRVTTNFSIGGTAPANYLYQPGQGPQYGTSPRAVTSHSHFQPRPLHFPGPLNVPEYTLSPLPLTPSQPSPLAADLLFNPDMPDRTTTLYAYLTSANPSPPLVRHCIQPDRMSDVHFWWDVRNCKIFIPVVLSFLTIAALVRPWSDFSLQGINRIPVLSQLLTMQVPERALPQPARFPYQTDSVNALHDMYTSFFVTKVTSGLKMCTNNPSHLSMVPQKPLLAPGAPKQVPDFIAAYSSSSNADPLNVPRLVGFVRTYENWNSGMRRSSNSADRVCYLRELAILQGAMRANSCRYGFIMTEIELVCVRMGTSGGPPYFGLLELSDPVRLADHVATTGSTPGMDIATSIADSAHSSDTLATADRSMSTSTATATSSAAPQNRAHGLTVALALWYLHMLASDQPLPGQPPWRIDMGSMAACTRRIVQPRDPGMIGEMKPEGREKRDAKRNRGWAMPDDPVHRKETGKPKRWTKKMERERLAREEEEDKRKELEEKLRYEGNPYV